MVLRSAGWQIKCFCESMGCTSSKSQVRTVVVASSRDKEPSNDKFASNKAAEDANNNYAEQVGKVNHYRDEGNEFERPTLGTKVTKVSHDSPLEKIPAAAKRPKPEKQEDIEEIDATSNGEIDNQSQAPASQIDADKAVAETPVLIVATTETKVGLTATETSLDKGEYISFNGKPEKRAGKTDLFKSVEEFRDVDSYALEAPKNCLNSFEDLGKYLLGPYDSDLYKVRSIWRWVTANISYDTDAFFSNDLSEAADEGNALKTGKAVCSGYSSLVSALCSCSGLECKEVHGYAKGYNYQVGKKFNGEKTNHSWSAIKINGQWYLFDFTWGAGYVGNDKKFAWHYTEHYFMTDPEDFILDHFPTDEEWQLINPSYPIEDFEKWAKFYKHFFINQLRPLSYKDGLIETDEPEIEVILGLRIPVQINAKLEFIDNDEVRNLKEYSFSHIKDEQAVFSARLPEAGSYNLKLFASKLTSNSVKSYDIIAQYRIHSTTANKDCQPFPKIFSSWGPGYVLNEPHDGTLAAGKSIKFSIRSPNAVEMHVCPSGGNGEWTPLKETNKGLWEGEVLFNEQAKEATVVVKVDGQTSTTYTGILKYTIK